MLPEKYSHCADAVRKEKKGKRVGEEEEGRRRGRGRERRRGRVRGIFPVGVVLRNQAVEHNVAAFSGISFSGISFAVRWQGRLSRG